MTPITRSLTVLGAAALVGSLAACSVTIDGLGRDPGEPTTQTREVTDVATVVIRTSATVQLAIGEPSLTVTAGEHVIDAIETDIDGDTLDIGMRGWLNPGPVHVDLVLPAADSLRLAGSGTVTGALADGDDIDIEVTGSGQILLDPVRAGTVTLSVSGSGDIALDVRADDVTTSITGSGTIELAGETTDLDLTLPGSGELLADGLTARDAAVDIMGSGRATVHVTDTLDVTVAGSGTVRYTGDPRVSQAITGSGSVRQG